ncbi:MULTISPECIES: chemotaxis response regulator protein-glutamate methylesterase [unclassified Sphingomonas]|uniref:protein-glutamate methylesterase/protein-glutamine glutaminase n=1 Tax=unclassified Sphingomonas TaxID=196159 RepID=UPI001F58094A|nr:MULTISPECIES: chemotaxis response regulator protein-glutamate methylesterase [unclassified Sphingomonas]
MRRTRVLIVDDSGAMRAALTRILSSDPQIEVVGAAPEPHAAREMIRALNPDVITLDVEMPGMDGLSFLERIMRLRPMPVVMVSSLTAAGASTTVEALRLGAVDCIAKPTGGPAGWQQDAALLCQTVRDAAESRARRTHVQRRSAPTVGATAFRPRLIVIGASTGGVEALFRILPQFPGDCPPVLVVQHMPAAFTASFADRLDRDCTVNVREAQDGAPLRSGTVYIAPGGTHHMALDGGLTGKVRLIADGPVNGHRPSVDQLFHSVAPLGKKAVGAILTGMGEDGARGLLAMRQAGARTFGQTRGCCVVWGMPRVALEMGAIEKEVSLSNMAGAILAACRDGQEREP